MTVFDRSDRFERELPEILAAIVAPRLPDYTDELLAQATATRQRSRWTFPERWFGMDATAYRASLPAFPWRPLVIAALLVALVVAAALLVAGSQPRVPPPFGPAKNGEIAFGDGDIWVRNGIDGESKLLIGGPTFDFAASFTRDGQRLTFLRRASGTPGTSSERLQLYVANADGTNVEPISEPFANPDWTDLAPDSSYLVVSAGEPATGQHMYIADLSHPGRLRQINLGANLDVATPSFIGPTGAEIVFRGSKNTPQGIRYGLFAVRPDGSGLRAITPTDGTDVDSGYQFPQPSPDGRYVAYMVWDDSIHGLRVHVVDLHTGEDRNLTDVGRSEGWATFSPDSKTLLYQNYTNQRYQFFVTPVDGGGPRLPIGPEYRQADNQGISGMFSPDGKSVIVSDSLSKQTRIVDATKGGPGEVLPWSAADISGWQRLAP